MTDVELNSFELKYIAFIYLHICGVVHINIDTYTTVFRNTFIRQLADILYTLYIHSTTDKCAGFLCHKAGIRVHQYINVN